MRLLSRLLSAGFADEDGAACYAGDEDPAMLARALRAEAHRVIPKGAIISASTQCPARVVHGSAATMSGARNEAPLA